MPVDRLTPILDAHVRSLDDAGTAKGAEAVVVAVKPAEGDRGPRFFLAGEGVRETGTVRSHQIMFRGANEKLRNSSLYFVDPSFLIRATPIL